MEVTEVTIGLAFLAGLASFLSPCVFSLVPAYISYLSGRSAGAAQRGESGHWNTFTHGLAFVLGFSLVFILLGVAASALGGILYDLSTILARIGGVIVVLLGLHMTGILRIPFLMQNLHIDIPLDPHSSYISSFLLGIFFSAGWSPCVGPVLGAILTLSLSGQSITWGVVLLAAYSAGLAIPFLAAAWGVGWVVLILKRYGKVIHYIEIGMGVILVIVGIMLAMGTFSSMARLGSWINLDL